MATSEPKVNSTDIDTASTAFVIGEITQRNGNAWCSCTPNGVTSSLGGPSRNSLPCSIAYIASGTTKFAKVTKMREVKLMNCATILGMKGRARTPSKEGDPEHVGEGLGKTVLDQVVLDDNGEDDNAGHFSDNGEHVHRELNENVHHRTLPPICFDKVPSCHYLHQIVRAIERGISQLPGTSAGHRALQHVSEGGRTRQTDEYVHHHAEGRGAP
eukprot:CAMPEP_0177398000 /NCGR_PEP_ID=MMETSP0368-20130122/57649_1 /TAXON_ID=447022 ORGANISM="Scrippsiella hangoei-like, Strain SHHI-4" /NCGR_SAMPLE_ID=MMETSP0368 /ASSEMBLY_ACC=CAM_ASM_000363 /LENGTH=213 /DNA_ID=CAMNT_0018865017 /DNA_START=70 /DNA_END=710 /DNA_ORIENTATION=+